MHAPNRFTLPDAWRIGPRWLAASVGAHALLVVALFGAYRGFVRRGAASRAVIAVDLRMPLSRLAPAPPPAAPPPAAGSRISAPVGAPLALPNTIPPAPPNDSGGVRGGVPGGTGIAMSPSRGDARLWVLPMYIPEGGGRPINMDSVVRGRMLVMADKMDSVMRNDSLSPLRNPLAPPRWTFDHNGKTYGIDQSGIHFGTFTIPTAALALLPFPQGNIDQARAYNRMMDMRADILRAAARAEAEDDFRRAVAQIRERKDRERREDRERRDRERRDGDRPIP